MTAYSNTGGSGIVRDGSKGGIIVPQPPSTANARKSAALRSFRRLRVHVVKHCPYTVDNQDRFRIGEQLCFPTTHRALILLNALQAIGKAGSRLRRCGKKAVAKVHSIERRRWVPIRGKHAREFRRTFPGWLECLKSLKGYRRHPSTWQPYLNPSDGVAWRVRRVREFRCRLKHRTSSNSSCLVRNTRYKRI